MSFFSRRQTLSPSHVRGKARTARRSTRPRLELLEDRLVPTAVMDLTARSPLGSLLYEGTTTGHITTAGEVASFTVDLDAGQTLSVAASPYMFEGHWYVVTSSALDWKQAQAEAVALGGHLVTINSQVEQDFITNTFLSGANKNRKYWIGLNDEASEGNFVWVSGEPVTYTSWFPGEPNNGSNVEDYVAMNYHHASGIGDPGLWNDEPLGGAFGTPYGLIELSGPTLRPTVSVTGPGGALTLPDDGAAGDEVLLQSIPVTTAGTYTVTISGLEGTTGRFQTRVLVNGLFEAEAVDGSNNGTLASAQDLDNGFDAVGGGRHTAVAGTLPANRGVPLFSDDFERDNLGAGWSTYSSLSTGRIQLTNQYADPISGKSLIMDDAKNRGTPGLNEAVWTVDLSGQSQVALSFRHANWNDEVTGFSGPFTGHANADGIAISADGINWYPAWTPPSQTAGIWLPYTIDLGAIAAQNGISLGSNFKIKFQQYGADPISNDGRGWDALRIRVPDSTSTANEDWYKFTLGAGERTTVTVTPQGSGAAHVQIFNANGVKLSDGDPTPTNVGEAITFIAPTAGIYYARVSGNDVYSTLGVEYTLTVTAGATFDLEENSGPQPWAGGAFQVIDANQGVLGALQKEPPTDFVLPGSGGLAGLEKIVFHDNFLFVVSRNTDRVMRYDAVTGAPRPSAGNTGAVFAVGGMSEAIGPAFGPDQNLYVADRGSNSVLHYNGETGALLGTFVSSGSGGLSGPQGLVFGPDGHLYVSSSSTNQVMRFNGTTGAPLPSPGNTGAVFAQGGGLNWTDGLTFGPDGHLYVASAESDQILRYDGATGQFLDVFVGTSSGGINWPSDLVFGDDGTLYVTAYFSNQLVRYQGPTDSNPGALMEVILSAQSGFARSTCLAFGPDGSLYATNRDLSSVVRVNFGSDFYLVSLQPGDVFTAETATPFAGGNLPVNNLNPMLRIYDSSGNLVASDDNGSFDFRNARLWYQAISGGDYYIEVASSDYSTGEYVLQTAVHPGTSPVLVIENITLLEGNSGTTNAEFTVRLLNPPDTDDVAVNYSTVNGTAEAGSDYTATNGTLTFIAGGSVTQTINVLVTGDNVEEQHEYFFIQLSNATPGVGLALGGLAYAGVLNDDTTVSISAPPPLYWPSNGHYYVLTSSRLTWQQAEAEAVALGGHLLTINSQAEQDFINATFLSDPSNQGPYWIGLNDQAVEGTFVWSSGEPVTYTNWQPNEPNNLNNEDYAIIYAPPYGWNDGQGTDVYYGIIELPEFTGDVNVVEGNSGQRNATFTVSLSTVSALPVTVQYSTDDGTAISADGDYVAVPPTTLTFSPGETIKTILVKINGDSLPEGNETFFVNLSNATGASITDAQAVGTIVNDDGTGSTSNMYVSEISHQIRTRGSKTDLRILVTVRSDSDADGVATLTDAGVSGASVSVQVTGASSASVSGTTDSTGTFISGWISNITNGTYLAEVNHVSLSPFNWNKSLDVPADSDTDGNPDISFPIGSPMVAQSLGSSTGATTLTEDQLQPLIQEAVRRYQSAGVNISALNTLDYRITDFGGTTLGLAAGNTILIDADAAGWGWFVDPTPWEDSEFTTPGDQGEQNRMDLLTVIMHEMGHVLGHDHEKEGVMQKSLVAGTRYSLEEHDPLSAWHDDALEALYTTLATENNRRKEKR